MIRSDSFWSLRAVLLGMGLSAALSGSSRADDFEIAPDLRIEEYASSELVHDVHSLTIDARGRVVVASPGSVKILVDDGSGKRAVRTQTFANGPASGAQGMYFHGTDLFCIGDQGLLRYRDPDGDGTADGDPDVFLKLKTGGEHYSHSIQKGPDGWWSILVGNMAEVDERYVTLPTSPMHKVQHGVLLRLTPDLKGGEIVCHGLRNAYDFAFDPAGRAWAFDSDDERDVSMPWYRPCRVLELTPTVHMGWMSISWKRPDVWFDSPRVAGNAGRGSPTGVICYRHDALPSRYNGALFILDWTYGRVLAVTGALTDHPQVETVIRGTGNHGFAPTDLEVGPDGAIYISIGGRGTRGGVYRVTANPETNNPASTLLAENRALDTSPDLRLVAQAKQPFTSWSRTSWIPAAQRLSRDELLKGVSEQRFTDDERIRCLEALTEVHGGLTATEFEAIQTATGESSQVLARAIWSCGRARPAPVQIPVGVWKHVSSENSFVLRAALELALERPTNELNAMTADPLAAALNHEDRICRLLASRLVAKVADTQLPPIATAASKLGPRALSAYSFGWMSREPAIERRLGGTASEVALRLISRSRSAELQREGCRLLQVALGDVGGTKETPPAFQGYTSQSDLTPHERRLDSLRIRVSEVYPQNDATVNEELERVIAMIKPANAHVLDTLLAQWSETSDPVHDLHILLVAARVPVTRSGTQRQIIASALLRMQGKFQTRKLPQDNNWNDRFRDLYKALVAADEQLPIAMVHDPEFGQPAHVMFMSEVPGELFAVAMKAFRKQITAQPEYPWNSEVIFLLAASEDPEALDLVRAQADLFATRGAVIVALSEHASSEDRELFISGLEASQVEVVQASVQALSSLKESAPPEELLALIKAFRRLQQDAAEYAVREKVETLLERLTGQTPPFERGMPGFHPQPKVVSFWDQWASAKYPDLVASRATADGAILKTIAAAPWAQGVATRGETVFRTRNCAACHGGRGAVGPDLTGVTRRFSRDDLMTAIIDPNRDVSARYQTMNFELNDGRVYSGMIIYESVDGLLLKNATGQTIRIESHDIEQRHASAVSLMPTGLLNNCTPQDVAELYAYLDSLQTPQVPDAQTKQ